MHCSGCLATSTTGLQREAKVMRGQGTKVAMLPRHCGMGQRLRSRPTRRALSIVFRLRRLSSSTRGRATGRPILTVDAVP